MKNLDSFSKRILVIAISFSLMLLSASVFLLTIQRATAQDPARPPAPALFKPTVVGLGIGLGMNTNVGYYMEWDASKGGYIVKQIPLK